MYVPYGPSWTWSLYDGEDGQFFSQPTVIWHEERMIPITGGGACVARCSIPTWMSEPDDSHTTYLIQCGQVARLAPDGTYLCDYHLHASRWGLICGLRASWCVLKRYTALSTVYVGSQKASFASPSQKGLTPGGNVFPISHKDVGRWITLCSLSNTMQAPVQWEAIHEVILHP